MKLMKSQQKENMSANANESADENNVDVETAPIEASLAPIEGNYFQDFENLVFHKNPFILRRQLRKSRFFQNYGTFNTNQNKKYHNFERNEIHATGFLK